ncbi:lipopolysaccharide biosynthesis protein [Sphingomonas morindae]|uniref:Lipopolysaccharide biosynthesis protein n=1 Tax=Sphingomonas morindae TaxID=1541170 RepID=A0ABY4XBR2_9SPHN|nr:lipopolysaccharide biosynthesis protein [Sphingomonas morindae]USI74135.1 lipopolysaccharide biosynthesis protein [Sphingomonas morindae]
MASRAAENRAAATPMAARVRAAVLWRSGSQIAGQLVMWSSTFLVLRLLAPADYGLFAMTQVVIGLATLLNGFSFAAALVRVERLDTHRAGQVFGVLILLNFGLALAQLLAAPWAAAYFHQPRLVAMLRVQSLLHLLTPFIIMPQALLAREIDFRTQGRANLVAAAAGAITAPLCALAGFGVWTLVAAPLALFGTRALMLGLLGRWWIRPRFAIAGAGDLLAYGGTVLVSDILWFVQNQADIVIAGRHFGAAALGCYSEGLFLTQLLVNKFVPALNEVAFPSYARLQAEQGAVGESFARAAGAIMLVALPCYAGLAATAAPLILAVMGPRWADAIPIVRVLALAMPFVTLHILYPPATNALGRPGIAARATAAGAVLLPLAFLVGVRFGPVGMAAAWLATMPVLLAISTYLSLPVLALPARRLGAQILPPLLAATLMGLAVALADRLLPALGPWPRLGLLVALGVLSYGALAWLVARPVVRTAFAMVRGRGAAA